VNKKTAGAVFLLTNYNLFLYCILRFFMNIINYYNYKILYPKFIFNIRKVLKDSNMLVRLKFNDDSLEFYILYENEIIRIYKKINEEIKIEKTEINKIIETKWFINLKSFIYDFELNAEIMSSQNVVDFIYNSFKEATSYYKMSRKEYEIIYFEILKFKDFYLENTQALVIENEKVKNKWID